MRISIISVGTRGDVQPLVALGKGLQANGYDIIFGTHENFEGFVTDYGLPFAKLSGNPQELVHSEAVIKWLESNTNPIQFVQQMKEVAKDYAESMSKDIYEICAGADAIIFSPLAIPTIDVAEKYNVPLIGAGLQPLTPTKDYPPMIMPVNVNLGWPLNYFLHLLFLQIIYLPMRGMVNDLRRKLELKPYRIAGPYWKQFISKKIPVLYGFSPTLLPPSSDWPDYHHVTGFWFLEDKQEYAPPQELVDFINDGEPPIYIGFGSMSPRDPEATTALIIEALNISKQRAVLLSGWAGLDASTLPSNIFKVDNVPHDWLFPQMKAVVHHGGAGTTAAGLRAGVPTIIAPFFSDQPFWGQRVHELGVGPKPIPQQKLTAEKLANAIVKATSSKKMKVRAKEVGDAIWDEDGVAEAVRLINEILK